MHSRRAKAPAREAIFGKIALSHIVITHRTLKNKAPSLSLCAREQASAYMFYKLQSRILLFAQWLH